MNKGEVIGKVGSTGKSSAPHIHFSVIKDKNANGDFNDDRPDGLVDPFGWQSSQEDPWPNYTFTYKGRERTGTKSYYLWTKAIENLSKDYPANGGFFNLGRFSVNLPPKTTGNFLTVKMEYSPTVTISQFQESIGPSLNFKVIDATGNPINYFPEAFTLTIDFSNFDISKYKPDSLSIYSSSDGISWTKEETIVDFENKSATATLNHASFFALVGEKKDSTPPVTQVQLAGNQGEEGWFRSDVTITLNPQDNDEGSGVYYTGYKLDDSYFQKYQEPILVSEEGEHTLEFYSVDNDENQEETKTITFHIDKTPPEAKIKFNPTTKDAEISGTDENPTMPIFENNNDLKFNSVVIKDLAGNSIKLEGKFHNLDKIDHYSIESIQYNEEDPFDLDKNLYSAGFSWNQRSQSFRHIIQSRFDKEDTLLAIIYKGEKDESEIFKKDKGEKVEKEIRPGLVLLYIKTNNGSLEFGYE